MATRLVSGVKPTGSIHIGNYFGAMRQILSLQDTHECFIFIADLHALNQVQDASELRKGILEIAKAFLATGLDPQKVTFFQQSAVPQVGNLSTILGAITSFGLLERAHAFKDARAKGKMVNTGLVTYPVLMAADILLYRGEVVPVGQDQQQHLEMTREIAERFNYLYGDTLTLPQPVFGTGESVTGLDGRKMSKSYGNVVGLFDTPEEITQKAMRVTTDSRGVDEPKDPDTCNVFKLHRLVAQEEELTELEKRYREGSISYKESKELLATYLNRFLDPIRAKKAELETKQGYIEEVLQAGAERARVVAAEVLQEVEERAGLVLSNSV